MEDDQSGYNAPHRFRVIHNFERYELWVEDRIATFESRAELERCVQLMNETQQRAAGEP